MADNRLTITHKNKPLSDKSLLLVEASPIPSPSAVESVSPSQYFTFFAAGVKKGFTDFIIACIFFNAQSQAAQARNMSGREGTPVRQKPLKWP